MDIIVVSRRRGQTFRNNFSLSRLHMWLIGGLLTGTLLSGGFYVGSWWGGLNAPAEQELDIAGLWSDEISAQRNTLVETRALIENNTHALARRLALLNAQMIRLDAAGQRLTEIADLDGGEFDFDSLPALGGPDTSVDGEGDIQSLDAIRASLDQYETRLADRERQMRVLEDLLLASRLQKEVKPSGWPVEGGWISSNFGLRTDPFTGRRAQHYGMDFAGRDGSAVLAVAAGVITEAGPRFGYGNLVEINHGNGYVTRYGHNKNVSVKVGQRVHKGQRVAAMGSTGRSTGPHVHFEVLLNGRVVNPIKYIQAAR